MVVESTSFLTQSTLPPRYTVTEHCTNYYVILRLTYLTVTPNANGSQIQLNTGRDQNYSLSGNHSERSPKNLSHQLFAFPCLSRT